MIPNIWVSFISQSSLRGITLYEKCAGYRDAYVTMARCSVARLMRGLYAGRLGEVWLMHRESKP